MPKIHLLLRGPAAAPYPNGGDEAYWMGQVAGALASHLGQEGIPLEWGPPQEEDALCLTLSSQAAPPERGVTADVRNCGTCHGRTFKICPAQPDTKTPNS